MASYPEWLTLLRKVFLFSSFTSDQLNLLAKKMTLVSYPKGAALFHEAEPGESLYLILSGSIRILSGKTGTEKESTLAYLNRGDVLGEMALLAAESRSHTAIVDSSAEVLVLQKKDFDAVLEHHPEMAVHLSRILSSRLASAHRHHGTIPQPTKIFSLVAAIPSQDQVVFTVNMAFSLIEQTRRKVLLCVFDEGNNLTAKSLGLDAPRIGEALIRQHTLQDLKKFNDHIMIHPSGIEILVLDSKVGRGVFQAAIDSFLSLIKDNYDIALFSFPSHAAELAQPVIQESDRVLLVSGPQSYPSDLEGIQKFLKTLPSGKKCDKIWLSSNLESIPSDGTPDMRFGWNLDWGRQLMSRGTPFFPLSAAEGQQWMDRLARQLTGLRVGFAMGSGAAFGYALIGMLRVLEREGIYIDIVSGTSMGALIGAFYSRGIRPDELETIACSITRKKLWQMADPILPRTGLIRGNGILNFLKEHLGDRNFNDLILPFSCVATDIQTGKEIVLDRGNVAEAVRASLSLPFFFQPYYLDGRYLVDGGLVNPVPTSIIVAQGAHVLLSANLTSKAGERRVPRMFGWWRRRLPSVMRGPSIPEIMIKTIYIMQHEIAQARSELAHVVMHIKAHDLLWWDLDQAKEMIRMGEGSAEEVLPKIKSLLPYFSDSCRVRLSRKGRKNY